MLYQKKVLAHYEVVKMHHEVEMHREGVEMYHESKFQQSLQSTLLLTTTIVPRSNVFGILCGHCYCHWLYKLPVTYQKACSHTI